MKKLLIILFSSLVLFSACNQKGKTEQTKSKKIEDVQKVELPKSSKAEDVNDKQQKDEPVVSGIVIKLTTETFKEKVWNFEKDAAWNYNGDLPCIIDFYADWCKPCKMVAPIMDKLAKDYEGKLIFYKVNTDQNRELSQVFQIKSIPSVLFVPAKGDPAMKVGAMNESGYIQALNDYVFK